MHHWNHPRDGASGRFHHLPGLPLVLSPSLFSPILGPQADSDLLPVIRGSLFFLECVTDVLIQCILYCAWFFHSTQWFWGSSILPFSQDSVPFYRWVVSCCRYLLVDIFLVLSSDEYSCYEYSYMNLGVDVCFYFSSVPRWLLLFNFYYYFLNLNLFILIRG